jgi:hypothetical protein
MFASTGPYGNFYNGARKLLHAKLQTVPCWLTRLESTEAATNAYRAITWNASRKFFARAGYSWHTLCFRSRR